MEKFTQKWKKDSPFLRYVWKKSPKNALEQKHKKFHAGSKSLHLLHRGLGAISTPQISKMNQTLVFTWGLVEGISQHDQFFLIPSLPVVIFSKNYLKLRNLNKF